MKKLIKSFTIIMLLYALSGSGVSIKCEDGGGSYKRMRLVSLQTLLGTKEVLVQQKWKELAEVRKKLDDLLASDTETISQEMKYRTPGNAAKLALNADLRTELSRKRKDILSGLVDLYSEIASIKDEIRRIREEMKSNQQILNGRWMMTLLPSGESGEVFLNQEGTLVSGEYHLENDQHGSLQGTFINRILVLERIDSQYGKMGRFEATLMKDDKTFKGSWYSYNFGSGKPITGPFKLERSGEENP